MKIQTKFILAGICGTLFVSALVGLNIYSDQLNAIYENKLKQLVIITQRHMEGDMMHDAIRSDVLFATLAISQGDQGHFNDSKKEFADHYQTFLQNVEDNQKEVLSEELNNRLNTLHDAVVAYGKAAADVFETAGANIDYSAQRKIFEEKFSALETENEEISEAIKHWMEESDAVQQEQQYTIDLIVWILSGISILGTLSMPFYSAWLIFRPQQRLIDVMHKLAEDDIHVEIPGLDKKNEIGEISRSVQIFKQNAIDKHRLESEQEETEARNTAKARQAREELAQKFEQRVQSIIQTVASAATELYHTSESMNSMISTTSDKANNVAVESNEASQNVQNVAAAAEEMSASVREIAQQIVRSNEAVHVAVTEITNADNTSKMLEESTRRIDQIVELIQNIAAQINLLALNATIESARSGEAGKGFAVVASEVKTLANQTTNATNEIANNIGSIQLVSAQVIEVMRSIKNAVGNVQDVSSAISTAIEAQTMVTNDIASNMSRAATGTSRINHDISEVSNASSSASEAANQTLSATRMLSKEAEKLRAEVSSFLAEIRNG